MKITAINLWTVPLTSHLRYQMAEGKTCDTVDSIVLRLDTDSGISGWGEVCPIPHYLPAYADGVIPAVKHLQHEILGENPIGVEALMSKLNRYLIGHPYAKSMIDMALWDITAKAANLPLYAFLGGLAQRELPIYHSISCVEPETMEQIAIDAVAAGIRQIQVKLGADGNWRNDVERLQRIRAAVPDDVLVYGDFNAGADALTAIRVMREVMSLDIMLEQPCETITQCQTVHEATGHAMKLDESAHDIASLLEGAERGCMQAVAIKTSKFGGVSAARKARDLCLHLGAKMCIEDTWGSDIATAVALHLGASTPAKFLLNVCDLSSYVGPRLDPTAPSRDNGFISVSDAPGLGVNPDLSVLGEAHVRYRL
ncbi:MAG: mandelate racemase/muconate lactonizing enzyme family protein [Gammaproteobacteria bacterium]|nr:mandelate racemase/muconate lactonizing enzyme family protein [Gammaproteobacteria bacterium]